MTDINYLTYGGYAFPLGKVIRWEETKEPQLSVVTMPAMDSSQSLAVDTLGVALYITVTTVITGSFDYINTTLQQLKAIADGYQTLPSQISSPFVCSTISLSSPSNQVPPLYNSVQGIISTTTAGGTNSFTDTNINFQTHGVVVGDRVKNLITGQVAQVISVGTNTLTLGACIPDNNANILPNANTPYACTTTIYVKVLSLAPRWELPGLNYCELVIQFVQTSSNG